MKKRASEVEPVVRNSPATTTTSGRVKIYSPTGKKQYRLTWYEDGKQNGTTAKSFTHAMEKASVIEKRLLAKHGDRSLLSVKEMIEAYLNPDAAGHSDVFTTLSMYVGASRDAIEQLSAAN